MTHPIFDTRGREEVVGELIVDMTRECHEKWKSMRILIQNFKKYEDNDTNNRIANNDIQQ